MQQVKIFSGIEGETRQLEKKINTWIAETGVKVLNITGNIAPQSVLPSEDTKKLTGGGTRRFAPSDVLIIVTYEK